MNDDEKQALLIDHGLREAELLRKLEQQTDWYQQRFNALRTWVNAEVRPLSEDAANRYFSIVANGSPAPHEQADWRETMHGLTMRAFMAERQRDSLVAVLARLFDWEDKTYAHAVMHVDNAVNNLRADLATANSERLVAEATSIRLAIETFAQSVDDAERHWEGPRGGQHVPYHGDWACANPSVRQRLKWWARHLRDAAKEGEG